MRHVSNLAAVIPVISLALNWPVILTCTSAALAIVWYVILISEKIYHWTKKNKYDLEKLNSDD